jgi:hypothetical protein
VSLFDEHMTALAVMGAMASGRAEDMRLLLDGLDRMGLEALAVLLTVWHTDAMEKAGLDPVEQVEIFRAKLLADEASGQ